MTQPVVEQDLIQYLINTRRREGLSAKEMAALLGWTGKNGDSMVYAMEQRRTELGTRSLGRLLKRTGSSELAKNLVIQYLLRMADTPLPPAKPRAKAGV